MGYPEAIAEVDEQIYAIYRKAYEDNRTNQIIRLDPDKGVLGELWRRWDLLHEERA